MMPWKLYADAAAYIFTWLIGYSSLMGAIGGILIADYWVLRRRELSAPICSRWTAATRTPQGRQPSRDEGARAGHPAGRARLPARRRHARRAGGEPDVFDSLYTYAWFVTFGLSFVLYLAFSRPARRRSRSDATREVAAHP